MAKISFWSVLGVIGTLSEEVTEALADDGKVSAEEILQIGKSVIEKLDLPLEEKSMARLDMILEIAEGAVEISKDGRVTLRELVELGEDICAKLGIDLDKEGIDIPGSHRE